jgi:alanine racemase
MRPTKATIRLGDIANNYQVASRLAPASQSIAVIKANAYGHGMVEVARTLQSMVPVFAVALMEEAFQLRDAGINRPILVLQGPGAAADIGESADNDFWLLLHRQQQIDWLLSAELTNPVNAWLKVDTGMHRLGFATRELERLCTDLHSSSRVHKDVVLCTQLACADALEDPMTREQVRLIRTCSRKHNLSVSIANSAGILFWPESHAEWNRPGYMLYGLCPTGAFESGSHGLRPAMTMSSEIIDIAHVRRGEGVGYGHDWVASRDSTIGTIPIGYGDGYPRHAPSGTPVLVNGKRVAMTGRVSMDAISVDLTDLETVEVGDPVELWGQNLCINELASFAGTIGYEILAGLTGRVLTFYEA